MSVLVNMDQNMDTGVTPALASFRVVVDGVPIIPTGFTWTLANQFDLAWGAPDTAVSGTVQLLAYDLNFRSATGVVVTAPQEVTFFP